MLPNLRSFIKRQASDTSSNNEWYNEWQQVKKNGNEWYNERQRVVQRVVQRATTNDNEWLFRSIFFFFERILLIGRIYWIKKRFSKSSSLE